MVFKRRDRRSVARVTRELLWPKGGWIRAIEYLKHRVRRLPDTPEKIARGIWAGLAVSFTPFVGVHFIVGGLLAWLIRGNIPAAVLATFVSNFLTIPLFGAVSLRIGYGLLGIKPERGLARTFLERFADAGAALWRNVKAGFGPKEADWSWLWPFYDEIFFPYLIGGLIPGVVFATLGYYFSIPVIRAYQNRRRGMLAQKFKEIREKALGQTEDSGN